MDVPAIRYAPAGDLSIAYQQWGSGPPAVGLPPFAQNIEVMWEDRHYRRVLERLGSFASMTQFDKRGTGLSDRSIGAAGLEERMDDFRAVMDAADLERASLIAVSEAGPMAILFAATYPDRVEKLVLYGTFATMPWKIDPAYLGQRELVLEWVEQLARYWGTEESLIVPSFAPSMLGDDDYRRWMERYERHCISPRSVRDLMHLNLAIDVADALPLVQADTLVLHRRGDLVVPVQCGRHLAEHLPNVAYLELDGFDHLPWIGDVDSVLDPVEEFICGQRRSRIDADRVLATVLFTDIVGSTERASALGDRAWHDLLDRHDTALGREIDLHGGRAVKTTGDGFLATFDSPGRAVRAARAMVEAAGLLGLEIRAGLHTGEVEMRDDDVAGMAVHIGARVSALARPSEVLVSSTVRDLVIGSEHRFEDRGLHTLKGVEGSWQLLAVA